MTKINILVVDDSAIVRDLLERELGRLPDMQVVGSAPDPYIARDKIARLNIDVIILDIEMPRMDGLTFLKYLMKYHPLPVIVLSSLLDEGNMASLSALELGAIGLVPKPGGPYSVAEVLGELIQQIRHIPAIDFSRFRSLAARHSPKAHTESKRAVLTSIKTSNKLICIGASTGGTVALEQIFRSYDRIMPPTLAVIHMPEGFTKAFAKRLNDICSPSIKEAEDGEDALPGYVYIAPGNYHMTVHLTGARYKLSMHRSPRLHGQRPAVDPLFESAANTIGSNAIGVLLTGMGRDGAQGLLKMKESGSHTICQDEKSSVVFGMPKAGIELGAACDVLSLEMMYNRLKELC